MLHPSYSARRPRTCSAAGIVCVNVMLPSCDQPAMPARLTSPVTRRSRNASPPPQSGTVFPPPRAGDAVSLGVGQGGPDDGVGLPFALVVLDGQIDQPGI